jgi:hypothetical protein
MPGIRGEWNQQSLTGDTVATELYELTVRGSVAGSFNESVMHFIGDNLTANATMANGEDLINSWETNIGTLWVPLFPTSYQIDMLSARRVVPIGSNVPFSQLQKGQTPGTAPGNCCGLNLCPTVFLIPPMGIKSGGKVFMPCISTARVGSNAYAGIYKTQIDTLFNAMATNFGTSAITWVQGIYSRKNLSYSHVMSHVLSARFGFQSRRRKPVGQ